MNYVSMQSFYPVAWMPRCRWSWLNKFWGFVNNALIKFSKHYVRWCGIQVAPMLYCIHHLPFNLLVKSCRSRSDVEREARATMMARVMGLPVPYIIGYSNQGPIDDDQTILMTKIPGDPLSDVYQSYSDEELDVIMAEVGACLAKMHMFASPYGNAVCGLNGEFIENSVLPLRKFARTANPQGFHESIHVWDPWFTAPNFDDLMGAARRLEDKDYRVVFGHGDIAPWNIMVKDGHLTGIIDWEFAGWYPQYWDYVNPLVCYGPDRDWAKDLSLRITGGEQYEEERRAWDAMSTLYGHLLD